MMGTDVHYGINGKMPITEVMLYFFRVLRRCFQVPPSVINYRQPLLQFCHPISANWLVIMVLPIKSKPILPCFSGPEVTHGQTNKQLSQELISPSIIHIPGDSRMLRRMQGLLIGKITNSWKGLCENRCPYRYSIPIYLV